MTSPTPVRRPISINPPSLLKAVLKGRAVDLASIQPDYGSDHRLIHARGVAEHIGDEVHVTGSPPNENAVFETAGTPYLTAWTSLVMWDPKAPNLGQVSTFGLQSATVQMQYETLVYPGAGDPGSFCTFAALKLTPDPGGAWKIAKSAQGVLSLSTQTVSNIHPISAHLNHAQFLELNYKDAAVGAAWEIRPEVIFSEELIRASFFLPVMNDTSGTSLVPFDTKAVTRAILHALAWCIGGAMAGSGGGPPGALGGCLGGAFSSLMADAIDGATSNTQGGGLGTSPSSAASTGGGPPPADVIVKAKKDLPAQSK